MIQLVIVIVLFILIEAISYFYQKQLDKIWILRAFLWLGIFIHELAHYLMCKLTLAPVSEFRVGLRQGHVTHGKSRIPILGNALISLAPLFVGLCLLTILFLWYFQVSWQDFFSLKDLALNSDWQALKDFGRSLVQTFNLASWHFWLYLFLNLNILATFVPSKQDFKNIAGILLLYIIASILIIPMAIVNAFLIYAFIFALSLLIIAFLLLTIIVIIKKVISPKTINPY